MGDGHNARVFIGVAPAMAECCTTGPMSPEERVRESERQGPLPEETHEYDDQAARYEWRCAHNAVVPYRVNAQLPAGHKLGRCGECQEYVEWRPGDAWYTRTVVSDCMARGGIW